LPACARGLDANSYNIERNKIERNFTAAASPDEADSSKQTTTYLVSGHIAHYVGHGMSVQ